MDSHIRNLNAHDNCTTHLAGPSPVSPQDPETYYRFTSSNTTGPDSDYQSNSPADSQAPIMASWRMRNNSIEEPQQPAPFNTESAHGNIQDTQQGLIKNDSSNISTMDATIKSLDDGQKENVTCLPSPMSAVYVNGEVGAAPISSEIRPQFGTYPVTPLSAGLKTSGTIDEQRLAELEEKARHLDKKDLAVKLKVRLAKVVLRSVGCACSIVVLALVASTFAIFYATRHLPTRNNLPAWSPETPQWPQILILVIASLSLILSLYIMYSYWSGGHSKAERIAMHATVFTAVAFIFTLVIWSSAIGIMQGSRQDNNNKDLWGWSCKDNTRKQLFKDSVNYDLVCRQQSWVLICAIIEILIELLIIGVYLFAFYRIFVTKKRLRKSLSARDNVRSSIWQAKLQSQREDEEFAVTNRESATNMYHQLNSNTPYIEAEEGHAVPILQAPPPGHNYKRLDTCDAPLNVSRVMPPPLEITLSKPEVPPTPKSVTFQEVPRLNTSESLNR